MAKKKIVKTLKSEQRKIPVTYKTYQFVDHDPAIDLFRGALTQSGLSANLAASLSGVSKGAIHNWLKGKTKRPQFATLNAAAVAVGYEFRFAPTVPSGFVAVPPKQKLRRV